MRRRLEAAEVGLGLGHDGGADLGQLSRVSFDSVSVGSIISASGTISGKYTVGGWKP